ncbi:hypothetical protein MNBD_BACTEROID06-405, partial [hydrothermal vent metagenome]
MKQYFLLLGIIISTLVSNGQTAMKIIVMMYKDADKIEGLIAEINKVERIENELIVQLSKVKLNRSP